MYIVCLIIFLFWYRLANWFLCFVTLGGIMSFMQISVIYGMTIGYHTGQEQLAYFAGKISIYIFMFYYREHLIT